jgi:hypothetical protein
MTRYALLKLIRRLVEALPGWDSTWMPRTRDGYKKLYVFMADGRRFEITIKEERWY